MVHVRNEVERLETANSEAESCSEDDDELKTTCVLVLKLVGIRNMLLAR